jgi:hypothetical protein
MKLYKSTFLVTTLLFLIFPLFGCGSEAVSEVSSTRSACIELMQKVPVYYEDFEFWDVKALRNDPDLEEMYKVWYERKVQYLEEHYDIKSSGIDYLAQGEGLLDIYKLDYDINAFRDKITTDFYRDMSYENAEVWRSPQNIAGSWVLLDGLLIRGANDSNVDDYLNVINGEELSMYDKNAADMLERLPEGVMTRISRSSYPEGLMLSGSSISKEGENVLRWTNVYMFESPDDVQNIEAEAYFDGIEDGFSEAESEFLKHGEDSPFQDFILERQGEFVKWSVSIEQKYMISLLFYG